MSNLKSAMKARSTEDDTTSLFLKPQKREVGCPRLSTLPETHASSRGKVAVLGGDVTNSRCLPANMSATSCFATHRTCINSSSSAFKLGLSSATA